MTEQLLGSERSDFAESATIGPYVLHSQIARGGMATIHVARLIGGEGFSRIVAAKRLLPEFAEDDEFVTMFLDEARIASKVHHRNVVPVLDVVKAGDEVILVQEYVHGVPLNILLGEAHQAHTHVPIEIAVSIAAQVLAGLHGAHETVGPRGQPLHIVHRDVSPGNVVISVDGTARLLDFGVAKAALAAHITRVGAFKGKRGYAAPEALRGAATPQSDIYSLSVVLWELLVVRRLHPSGQPVDELFASVLSGKLPTITEALAGVRDQIEEARWLELQALEPIVLKGLALEARDRWTTAAEMEEALTTTFRPASPATIATWVKSLGKQFLDTRDQLLASEAAEWRNSKLSLPRIATRVTESRGLPRRATELDADVGHRRFNRTIVLLSSIIAVLAIVVVVAVRTTEPNEPAEIPEEPRAAAIAPAPLSAVVDPSPTPRRAAIAAPTKKVTPESPKQTPAMVREKTTLAPPAKQTKPAVQQAQQTKPAVQQAKQITPAVQQTTKQAKPAVQQATKQAKPAVQPTAKTSAICNTPYYFKGKKKVFKPACL
jgi:serine/threonine protein kinase